MIQSTPGVSSLTVKKRNGQQVPFYDVHIFNAIESAFKAHYNVPLESELDTASKNNVRKVTEAVVKWCEAQAASKGAIVFIEDIQNTVIRELKEQGFEEISVRYAAYRRIHELKRFESERITVKKRDGKVVSFKPEKIAIAVGKALSALHADQPLDAPSRKFVLEVTDRVATQIKALSSGIYTIDIEEIQDIVERTLMKSGHAEIAKRYIVYREQRRQEREQKPNPEKSDIQVSIAEKDGMEIVGDDGRPAKLDIQNLKLIVSECCHGIEDEVSVETILMNTLKNCFKGMKASQIEEAMLLAVRPMIEKEPSYTYVAARLLLRTCYAQVVGRPITFQEMRSAYAAALRSSLEAGVRYQRVAPALLEFDLDVLGAALKPERDFQFGYMGLQTLFDRYFIHEKGRRLESPQIFWMRVAMGLSIKEGEQKNDRAIEFYNVLSTFRFVSSTPTLFNAGTLHSQLSSCFLTTISDDLDNIFKCVKDNAMLSKWSGGLGNDWTPVRGMGSQIKGTNGKSQGLIPFMKVANDTAVAVNQGGKRQGAVCAYLEVWHWDIEEFLELRKNTGDDRRRTHDMHTAAWIPDLFMKRVLQNHDWTLFSPDEVRDLHDLFGEAFEKRYHEYEEMAKHGKIRLHRTVPAVQLWRKMLGMLFETGHPWITFKDPSNLRSPQDHQGVVHSSNLCTEILLNTSKDETAVCNLGSVNLAAHTTPAGLNADVLGATVRTAMRMLDNVIDINYYPTIEAENSNLKHRPVGLGLMGFQDALFLQNISYASQSAVEFADECMELISYHAILGSTQLAKERGTYQSYKGSKWDRGLLPIDTIGLLAKERGEEYLEMDRTARLDWTPVREAIKQYGMRNSNCMAIAPTATIANITGVDQSIEPIYKHLFVKSNLSGEFTVPNPYLVEELKAINLWDQQMIDDLKYFDGNLTEIPRIPQEIKDRYPTAFEIGYEWIIECASRRQKWIDMGQSLNLYLAEPSGRRIHNMYMMAWRKGLKTTYYLRSLGATRIEKSTVDVNKYGDPLGKKTSEGKEKSKEYTAAEKAVCRLDNKDECEACQ
ncbi:MAG: ribonucleoside-diphosphate reductase subunit alpha [Candidatus Omnitrophica bacterium]|nr:ribonucleoside-diphosphate reductase subunit alpha [Candidatus Omnitrophota bacterium]